MTHADRDGSERELSAYLAADKAEPGQIELGYDTSQFKPAPDAEILVGLISNEDLNALEELSAAATPSPWNFAPGPHPDSGETKGEYLAGMIRGEDEKIWVTFSDDPDRGDEDYLVPAVTGDGPTSRANAAFIANVRNLAPLLIAEIRADRLRISKLEAERNRLDHRAAMNRVNWTLWRDRAEAAERALADERETSRSLREDVIKELGRMLADERAKVARVEMCDCGPVVHKSGCVVGERAVAAWRAMSTHTHLHEEKCHHCGQGPDPDGDHSCPCPHSDETCPDHPHVPEKAGDA